MAQLIPMIGKRFGRLVVQSRAENDKEGKPQYLCRCTCGNKVVTRGKGLRLGRTRSCGCYGRERRISSIFKHGYAFTATYAAYQHMMARCNNPNNSSYPAYGGRGIKVCKRWHGHFKNFLADMGERPDGLSLDRRDSLLGYSPNNCRWATKLEQANNKRNNRLVSHNGETLTIAQWARKLGLKRTLLATRINKGWPIEKAFSFTGRPAQTITYKGQTKSIAQWSRELRINYLTIRHRLKKGWTAEEALSTPIR